jgi:hypothetical protein
LPSRQSNRSVREEIATHSWVQPTAQRRCWSGPKGTTSEQSSIDATVLGASRSNIFILGLYSLTVDEGVGWVFRSLEVGLAVQDGSSLRSLMHIHSSLIIDTILISSCVLAIAACHTMTCRSSHQPAFVEILVSRDDSTIIVLLTLELLGVLRRVSRAFP